MTDLAELRRQIQTEESEFGFAISESMIQKIGQSINFINSFQHSEKQFFLNGDYSRGIYPYLGADGFTFFQYDAEIIDAYMFVQFAGSAGTTELDIKRATSPGGAFTSIFSTTPKITSAAGNNVWINVGSALANTTAPIFSTTNVDADDALRLDIITSQTGITVNGAGLVIHYRPR